MLPDPHDPPHVSQAQGALWSSCPVSSLLTRRATRETFRELRGSPKIRSRETDYAMGRLRSSPAAVIKVQIGRHLASVCRRQCLDKVLDREVLRS